MIHARSDYAFINDVAEIKIKADEPVLLLRAKDKLAPMTLRFWANKLESENGDSNMIKMVRDHANLMEEWQEKNGCKLPDYDPNHLKDVPAFLLRLQVERAELEVRCNKLNEFLNFNKSINIEVLHVDLLEAQLQHMQSYLNVLIQRIELLNTQFNANI